MRPPSEPLTVPTWYVRRCQAIGRAVRAEQLTDAEATALLNVEHGIMLDAAGRVWQQLNNWAGGREQSS
jgi:hypothetical protein